MQALLDKVVYERLLACQRTKTQAHVLDAGLGLANTLRREKQLYCASEKCRRRARRQFDYVLAVFKWTSFEHGRLIIHERIKTLVDVLATPLLHVLQDDCIVPGIERLIVGEKIRVIPPAAFFVDRAQQVAVGYKRRGEAHVLLTVPEFRLGFRE